MRFTFKVEAEAMRISGKFGRHDKIANDIKEALLEALPERLTSDGEKHTTRSSIGSSRSRRHDQGRHEVLWGPW